MLSHPYSWKLTGRINGQSSSRMETNIPFWSIPGIDRQLMCDVWQPAPGVHQTGAAIIYFHSSAWCLVDKDFGTRPLLEYLAGQGYVSDPIALLPLHAGIAVCPGTLPGNPLSFL